MRVVRRADLPVWRSLLFMPVNVDRYARKAADAGSDAVVLDLDGSVTLRDKPLARALVAEAASIAGARGADVLVRINRTLDLAVRDIEDVVSQQVAALVVPRVESVGHVRMLSEFVAQVEQLQQLHAIRDTGRAGVDREHGRRRHRPALVHRWPHHVAAP